MDNDIRNYIKVDKLSKEKQPEIFEKEGRGYFYTHNGASACVFHNGEPMRYLGYVEFVPYRSRGNHFHNIKNENICVISGKIKAKFAIPENPEDIYEIELEEGDIVHIKKGCAHSYISEVKASIIEYSPEKYQKSDTVKYSFKWENEIF